MNQHRGPLLPILFALVIVTGGVASPIHKSAMLFAFRSAYAIYSSTVNRQLAQVGLCQCH